MPEQITQPGAGLEVLSLSLFVKCTARESPLDIPSADHKEDCVPVLTSQSHLYV